MESKQTRFIPVEKWNDVGHLYPGDDHEWRYILRNRASNGLDSAVVKIGRRLLIDEQAFLSWIESHREAKQ